MLGRAGSHESSLSVWMMLVVLEMMVSNEKMNQSRPAMHEEVRLSSQDYGSSPRRYKRNIRWLIPDSTGQAMFLAIYFDP